MNDEVIEIKNKILLASLSHVSFDGWSMNALECGAADCGYNRDMVDAVFINGVKDAVEYFSIWADDEMYKIISDIDISDLSIRQRIYEAVSKRIYVLSPYKEAVKMGLSYWGIPMRGVRAGKALWRSADIIWNWAGDKSSDYNRYTKRLILSTIIASVMLYWLQDDSENAEDSLAFLSRKIEKAVEVGKLVGRFKKRLA